MLAHLFVAELVYRAEMEPLTRAGEGELIGSGDGTVVGDAIAGALAWRLFERPGKLSCAMNPVAVIETGRARASTWRRAGSLGDQTRQAASGRSPRRCGSKATTSATSGWTTHSACGRANSTRRRTEPATRRGS
jgi:hypothetical protein